MILRTAPKTVISVAPKISIGPWLKGKDKGKSKGRILL